MSYETDHDLACATVDPFLALTSTDPAADTLWEGSPMTKTQPPTKSDWQIATLHNLTDVEDLLDCLEAHGVREREFLTLSNDSFAVRWRR